MTTIALLKNAKAAAPKLALLKEKEINEILLAMADALEAGCGFILSENEKDLANVADTMNDVMKDRLRLTKERIAGMAKGMREVAELPSPVGYVEKEFERPNGLKIRKVRVPMGVVAMIYESRPNVTADGVALNLKSGNVCVLRGGKEAILSSTAIVKVLKKVLTDRGYPDTFINIVEDTSRESANTLMTATGLVDLLIPRGGKGLISACVANAKVPVIQTGTGICHLFVDESADLGKALDVIENAKTSRPSVCNALEVCLVHEKIADKFLPMLKQRLCEKEKNPVELRLDEKAAAVIEGTKAGENDFDTEFLNYILAVKVVRDVEEAIEHISLHSTKHSDGILTQSKENASLFTAAVDSAAVYVNASTRFTDGGEFGLGCEIGISTQKMHARGPMGLFELTTYKYIIEGDGQIR